MGVLSQEEQTVIYYYMTDLFLWFLLSANPSKSEKEGRATLNLARQSLIADVPAHLLWVESDI